MRKADTIGASLLLESYITPLAKPPGGLCLHANIPPSHARCSSLMMNNMRMQVVSALGNSYTRPEIIAAIDFLKDQGHLFTTTDDDHCMWCS